MYFKTISAVCALSIGSTGFALADSVDWKYFTTSSFVEKISSGTAGFLVCADAEWDNTASEKEQSIFRRNTRLEFPAVPKKGDDAFNCVANGNDVVAVNWGQAEHDGSVDEVLAAIASMGLKEATLPE